MKIIDDAVLFLGQNGIAPNMKRGKICYETNQKPGGPWYYIRYSDNNCTMLRTFMYDLVSKKLPNKDQFIPSGCQECYKVVIRPESYDELLSLIPIMKEMDFPSKLGIEKREDVDALYGAYFYCNGLEEGKKRLEQVEFALLNTNMLPFLKRGCTEYEADFGPSDTWEIKPGQEEIEEEVYKNIMIDNYKRPQTESDIKLIMEGWKEFAEAMGVTYKPSHKYVTY